MDFLALQERPLFISIIVFAIAAAFVWAAGVRLSGYVDRLARLTGWGGGYLGLLLLGGITSLPEVGTVSAASFTGNAPLAINNVLGSAAINIVLLAAADAFLGRRALTSVVDDPTPMLQGALGILLLSVVIVAISLGEVAILGVGLWAASLLPLFAIALWLNSRYQRYHPWLADGEPRDRQEYKELRLPLDENRVKHTGSVRTNLIKIGAAAVVIFAAGYFLARSGDAIATQTGLGASMVGAVLLGFATSLPEISSVYAAIKLARYSMALGDIFGTNIFNFVLIFLADVIYQGGPVLNEAGAFEIVISAITISLTSIYLIGLLVRADRTVWRMGIPSLAVIVTYATGLTALALSGLSVNAPAEDNANEAQPRRIDAEERLRRTIPSLQG